MSDGARDYLRGAHPRARMEAGGWKPEGQLLGFAPIDPDRARKTQMSVPSRAGSSARRCSDLITRSRCRARLLHHGQSLPELRVIAVVGAVGELRRTKPRIASETGNPVSVKKGVELLGGIAPAQVIKVVLPYPIVRRILHFEEGKHKFSSRLQYAKGVENVEKRFCRIEVREYRPVKHNSTEASGATIFGVSFNTVS